MILDVGINATYDLAIILADRFCTGGGRAT